MKIKKVLTIASLLTILYGCGQRENEYIPNDAPPYDDAVFDSSDTKQKNDLDIEDIEDAAKDISKDVGLPDSNGIPCSQCEEKQGYISFFSQNIKGENIRKIALEGERSRIQLEENGEVYYFLASYEDGKLVLTSEGEVKYGSVMGKAKIIVSDKKEETRLIIEKNGEVQIFELAIWEERDTRDVRFENYNRNGMYMVANIYYNKPLMFLEQEGKGSIIYSDIANNTYAEIKLEKIAQQGAYFSIRLNSKNKEVYSELFYLKEDQNYNTPFAVDELWYSIKLISTSNRNNESCVKYSYNFKYINENGEEAEHTLYSGAMLSIGTRYDEKIYVKITNAVPPDESNNKPIVQLAVSKKGFPGDWKITYLSTEEIRFFTIEPSIFTSVPIADKGIIEFLGSNTPEKTCYENALNQKDIKEKMALLYKEMKKRESENAKIVLKSCKKHPCRYL